MAKSYKYKRSRKALKMQDLKLRLTDAIKEMERIILDSADDQKQIQACNTMAGLVNRYSKLLEVDDLEKRITELENQHENRMRKVS